MYDTFDEEDIYDNIYIDNLHLDNVDQTHFNYYKYLLNSGFLSAEVAQKHLFPYRSSSKLNKSTSNNVYNNGSVKLFNVFPISLHSLKAIDKIKSNAIYGKSGSTNKPVFKIKLNFTDTHTDISKFYLHLLYQNTQKIKFTSDPFNNDIDIEKYNIFT